MFPTIRLNDIPLIDTDQMIEVDRRMIEDYRIDLTRMMENAGRNLAHLARELFLASDPTGKPVLVMAGSGGNGGGALVGARRLSNWGADVRVALGQGPDRLKTVPAQQLYSLQQMGVAGCHDPALVDALTGQGFALILDGLIGYSLSGPPQGLIGQLIRYANQSDTPILALDTPSGVDTTSGTIHDPAIQAEATMTLALPKAGLFAPGVERQTGDLYLADISVPPALISAMDAALQAKHLFARNDIVKIARN